MPVGAIAPSKERMDHGTSATADKQLARRLHALEDELRELRRSIGQGQQHSSNLPSPPFQALRVMVDDDVGCY